MDSRPICWSLNLYSDQSIQRFAFALKTFHGQFIGACDNEIDAFKALRTNDGMIRYLGTFSHDSHLGGPPTSNILLEYGDLDLDEFFFDHAPPALPAEIVKFWEDLFEVPTAVRNIHEIRPTRGDRQQKYYG